GAAAELAERRAREEAQRVRARARGPATAEDIARMHRDAAGLAELRDEREWQDERDRCAGREPAAETDALLLIYRIPASDMDEVLALHARSAAERSADRAERSAETPPGQAELLDLAGAAALSEERLPTRGELSAALALFADGVLAAVTPDQAVAVYAPDQVRAAQAALERWEQSHGGREPALAELTARVYGRDRALTERTYGRLRALVDRAAEHGHGLVWMYLDMS
ncbi:MAG: hypothetical protein AAGC55_10075, partial [Myxococcota bacterium]